MGHLHHVLCDAIFKEIEIALLGGHHDLAGRLLQHVANNSPKLKRRISELHINVLLPYDETRILSPALLSRRIRPAHRMTPMHCAACNPDPRVLERIIQLGGDVHVQDGLSRRPVHLAATCAGTQPLTLLLQRGCKPYVCDRQGNLPVHFAVRANRDDNIRVLVNSQEDVSEVDNPLLLKYGSVGLNRPNKRSYTTLHLAVEGGFMESVKLLVENGGDVNATLNRTELKLTPLMLAAQRGFFNIAVFLVENNAAVERRDVFGRTAVIHAAMNGNANVLSYLLNLGASPTRCDSSGNSPLHYAAAYGWYFCVKTLLEAGADPNVANEWKVAPMYIAYMKGQMGMVSTLLDEADGDINFVDDTGTFKTTSSGAIESGTSLLSLALSSTLCSDLYEQVRYLVHDKKADCNLKDKEGRTALCVLAFNKVYTEGSEQFPALSEEAMETSVRIARLLVEHGADLNAVDKHHDTPAMRAMLTGNIGLVKYLVESGSIVNETPDPVEHQMTILNRLCYDHMTEKKDYLTILKYAASANGSDCNQNLRQTFKDMVEIQSDDGATPIVSACIDYTICKARCIEYCTDYDKAAVRTFWQRGRDFIRFLIEEFGADANYVYKTADDDTTWHLCSMVAIMTDQANCEYGGQREKDEPEFPGLKMILEYHPDVNTHEDDGYTPLVTSISKQVPAATELLLKEGHADPNLLPTTPDSGVPPLIHTIRTMGKGVVVKIVKLLIEAGANVNAVDQDGFAPIHGASFINETNDAVQITKMLLEHGADVNTRDKEQRTVLHTEVDENTGRLDSNMEQLLLLLDNGADLLARDDRGRILLHYALLIHETNLRNAWTDPLSLYQLLVSRMRAEDLNIQDKFGMTALHRAAFRGAYISCMLLLQHGADGNVKDCDGNTPLAYAARSGNDRCATAIIQEGARVDITVVEKGRTDFETEIEVDNQPAWSLKTNHKPKQSDEKKGVPLFEYALMNGLQGVVFMLMEKPLRQSGIMLFDAVEILLKQGKYNAVSRLLASSTAEEIKALNTHGRNMLHVMSLSASTYETTLQTLIDEFVKKGVCPYQDDHYKCTPLLYAALNNNWNLCKLLLPIDVKGNKKFSQNDSFGRNIVAATFWGKIGSTDKDFIAWLDELKSRNLPIDTFIDCPVEGDQPWCVDDKWKPDYLQKYNCTLVTPLISAVHLSGQKVLQWLLKRGVGVNTDSDGGTPLLHAVRVNDIHMVKTLMNFDHDPEAKAIDPVAEEEKTKQQKKKVQERVFKLKPRRTVSSLVGSFRHSQDDEDVDEKAKAEHSGDQMDHSDHVKDQDQSEPVFKPYKKRSDVDLNAVDKDGWTAIHHAACPLSFGTFDNDEMVFILAKAGAKLTVKNKKGETPLDLAIRNGAFRIARMIQELENVPKRNRKEAINTKATARDDIDWGGSLPSFQEDAGKQIDKVSKPVVQTDKKKEEEERVDKFNLKGGTLVEDDEQDLLYDVLLSKVELNASNTSIFLFYIMQIIYLPGRDLYVLFTRWGHVGDSGQKQHTPFQKKEDAIKEFSKIFLSKTGNEWSNIKSFEKKRKRYHLVMRKKTGPTKIDDNVEFESQSSHPSKLPETLQTTIREMINVKSLKTATRLEPVSSALMPFGSISREQLQSAMELLNKISTLVGETEDFQKHIRGKEIVNIDETEKENYQQNCEVISELSCEYFQILPREYSGVANRRPLAEQREVTKEMRQVANLLDYEVASRMLLAAKFREKEMNPLDYVYRSVGCQIQLLEENDQESQYILTYIKSSDTEVEAIYRLERDGEQERMDRMKLDNHRLLFHGSGVCNFISILHRGLVITPLDASYTGNLYGQGIYFSDAFDESLNYCDNGPKRLFMLICEVALGKTKVVVNPEQHLHKRKATDEPFDSVLAVGQKCPEEKYDITMPNGAILPLGKQKEADLSHIDEHVNGPYNKYVVYDEAQVCLRYLIQFKD